MESVQSLSPRTSAPTEPPPSPANQTQALKDYWVDLTKNGYCGEFPIGSAITETQLNAAYKLGKLELPNGDEPLIAYYLNACPLFFFYLQKYPPEEKTLTSSSPLGLFLSNHHHSLMVPILYLVGYLHSGLGISKKLEKDQVEIKWDLCSIAPPLHLLLPLQFEGILELISTFLHQNEPATLMCLSQALALFSPDGAPSPPPSKEAHPCFRQLYLAICKHRVFSDAIRFLYALKCGGFDPCEIATLSDLPDQFGTPGLKELYEGTKFAPYVTKATKQELLEELMICTDQGALSQTWKRQDIKIRPEFLLRVAATIPDEALPYALQAVYKGKSTPDKMIQLLEAYFFRVRGSSFKDAHEPKLRSLIDGLQKHLSSAPRLFKHLSQENPSLTKDVYKGLCDEKDYSAAVQFLSAMKAIGVDPCQVASLSDLLDQFDTPGLKELYGDTKFAPYVLEPAQLLVCTDQATLSRVWTDKKIEKRVEFLLNAAAAMPDEPLPFVLSAIPSFPREGQIQLLEAYFPRARNSSYEPHCRKLIDKNAQHLCSAPKLARELLKERLESKNWNQLASLLGILQKDGSFFEEVIQVLERASTQKEAAPCFKAQIESPGKRLSKEQKQRVAGAIATFVETTQNKEILAPPLDLAWVKNFVSKEQYIRLCDAIGEPLLAPAPVAVSIPKTLHEQVDEALKEKDFPKALELVKTTKPPEWELWGRLICSDPPESMVENLWVNWIQTHPIEEYQPEHEQNWRFAIENLLAKIPRNSSVFNAFFCKSALQYAEKLGDLFVQTILKKAIEEIGHQAKHPQLAEILGQIRAIDVRGDIPTTKLDFELQAAYNFLLVRHPVKEFSDAAIVWWLYQISQIEDGNLTNAGTLIKTYCTTPFCVVSPEIQGRFLKWFDICKKHDYFNSILWSDANNILVILRQFTYPTSAGGAADFSRIYDLWTWMAKHYKMLSLEDQTLFTEYFIDATDLTIRSAVQLDPSLIESHLMNMQKEFFAHFAPSLPTPIRETYIQQMRSYFACRFLRLKPLTVTAMRVAIENIKEALPFYKASDTKEDLEHPKYTIGSFQKAIPQLLATQDLTIHLSVNSILQKLLEISWIQNAPQQAEYGWQALLAPVCSSLKQDDLKSISTLILSQTFIYCTHPNFVLKWAGKKEHRFSNVIAKYLSEHFFATTNLSKFNSDDWGEIIGGVSNPTKEIMVGHLLGLQNNVTANITVAHIIRHTDVDKKFEKKFEKLSLSGIESCLKLIVSDPGVSLDLFPVWIQALSAHKHNKTLKNRKVILVNAMTTIICDLIKDTESLKFYSRILIETLGDDKEVAQEMHKVLQQYEKPELTNLKKLVAQKAGQGTLRN